MTTLVRSTWMLLALVALFSRSAQSYETETHARITQAAFQRSALAGTGISERLGWVRYEAIRPFRPPQAIPNPGYSEDFAFDLLPSAWTQLGQAGFQVRATNNYERSKMPDGYASGGAIEPTDYLAWLMRGAIREDDLAQEAYTTGLVPDSDPYGENYRVFNHFYDPVGDRPLDLGSIASFPVCDGLQPDRSGCNRSTDWAMGATGVANLGTSVPPAQNSLRRNHFSWADAREAMWCGLTYRKSQVSPQVDAATRRGCWATAMRALGQVLHLVQDSAQPQHVRNDRHNPTLDPPDSLYNSGYNFFVASDMSRRTFEVYTNWRAVGGSQVEAPDFEIDSFDSMFVTQGLQAAPLVLNNGYPIPRFAQPIDYITTRGRTTNNSVSAISSRRGIADFTNRNFFSEGTLFGSTFPLPPANTADAGWVVAERQLGSVPGLGQLAELEYRWSPIETVAPGFADPALSATGNRIPLAVESLWDAFVESGGVVTSARTLPPSIYRVHGDVLLPRAAAYSAGMIDYFFRGELEVSEPSTGLIAVVDQGTPHTVVQGYPRRGDNKVFGFTRVRLGVRNTTPQIAVSGTGELVQQQADSGELVAVARYHRNPCYLPSLYGEWTVNLSTGVQSVPSGGCTRDQLRTGYEEASVSAAIPVTGPLSTSQPTQYLFDFSSDPIPINATDLFVQVVYRGRLGEERDGIAVGRRDLPEAFHFVVVNNTDYYDEFGDWVATGPGFTDYRSPDSADLFQISWKDTPASPSAGLFVLDQAILPSARFIRVAVIGRVAPGVAIYQMKFSREASPFSITSSTFAASTVRQLPLETALPNTYNPEVFGQLRGFQFHRFAAFYYAVGDYFAAIEDLPAFQTNLAMPNVVDVPPPYLRADP